VLRFDEVEDVALLLGVTASSAAVDDSPRTWAAPWP
jgi:hypothetical protein